MQPGEPIHVQGHGQAVMICRQQENGRQGCVCRPNVPDSDDAGSCNPGICRQRHTRVCILPETHAVPREARGNGRGFARIARGTVDALPRRPAGRFNRRVAHRLFERAERRQVLGRAPGNEAGPAAVSSEPASESPACSAVRSGVCPIPCGQVSAEAWPSTSELADQGAILALAERLECTAAGSDSGALAQRPYPSRLDNGVRRLLIQHVGCRDQGAPDGLQWSCHSIHRCLLQTD